MFAGCSSLNQINFHSFVTNNVKFINPLASPSEGAPTLKYGDVNRVTTSPGEVKGLIIKIYVYKIKNPNIPG